MALLIKSTKSGLVNATVNLRQSRRETMGEAWIVVHDAHGARQGSHQRTDRRLFTTGSSLPARHPGGADDLADRSDRQGMCSVIRRSCVQWKH
jgi:hypothetical protein